MATSDSNEFELHSKKKSYITKDAKQKIKILAHKIKSLLNHHLLQFLNKGFLTTHFFGNRSI